MARGKRRPKPMSPKAGIKRTRYGCGGKLKYIPMLISLVYVLNMY
jgi:hypothetical protein